MYQNNSAVKSEKQVKSFIRSLDAADKNIKVGEDDINTKSGTIYKATGNLLIIKETCRTVPHNYAESTRGVITGFSPSAGVRMRGYLRSCLANYTTMLTLTYPFSYPTNGRETKEHLRRFLQELRREAARAAYVGVDTSPETHSSFWFLEFQQRGAPHYHIFTTWAPSKEWVARRWYEIVNSEDERHLHAGTRTEYIRAGRKGAISYASKYAAKLEQKICPENFENVGRWWGIHGYRATLSADTFVSVSDKADSSVASSIKNMFRWIEWQLLSGKIEIYYRGPGVCVMNLQTSDVQRRARMWVSVLGCQTMRFSSMFYDAELDLGETLCQ